MALVAGLLGFVSVSPAQAAPSVKWAALGDSFSAGVGIGLAEGTCDRHTAAYAPRAKEILLGDGTFSDVDMSHVACSGAVTGDYFAKQADDVDPQRNAISDETQIVTMTMGGNDISFADKIYGCLVGSCGSDLMEVRASNNGANCFLIFKCTGSNNATWDTIYARLVQVYSDARTKMADDGFLFVASYPMAFALSGTECLTMSYDEQLAANALITRLGDTIYLAVQAVNQSHGNVRFVDWRSGVRVKNLYEVPNGYSNSGQRFDVVFTDHGLCSADNSVTPFLHGLVAPPQNSVHPNDAAYAFLASKLAAAIRSSGVAGDGGGGGGGGGGGDDGAPEPPPPLSISAQRTPGPNGFGWNNTNVTVSFSCGGGLPAVVCPSAQTVSAEGTHTVGGTATDAAGQSKSTSVSVSIDKTNPVTTIGFTPAANAAGWYKTPPSLTGGCSDALSGVASCSSPTVPTSSFVGDLTRSAVDKADNSSSASVGLKLDTKPPTITPSMVPDLNENGWSRTDDRIVVFFDCEDPLENGVASGLEVDTCPVPQAVLKVGVTPITVSATDVAGNTTTITTYVRIDRTAPTLTIVPDREPDTEEGWYTDPVTLTGDCDDTESPILDCTEETVEEDGIHTMWLFAENAADFVTSRKTTIKMDINGPEIEPVFTGTMGSNGYFTTSVGVSFVCTDAGIGVKTCPKRKSVSKDGVTHIEATATDKLGHESTIIFDVIIDKTKPRGTITKLTKNTVAPGGVLKGTMGDAFSGVDSGFLEIANGNGTALIDVVATCNSGRTSCTWTANALSQPGNYTMKLAVIDDAGNVYRTTAYRFTIK